MTTTTGIETRQATIVMLDLYWRITNKPRKQVRWMANTFGVCDNTIWNDLAALKAEGRIPE